MAQFTLPHQLHGARRGHMTRGVGGRVRPARAARGLAPIGNDGDLRPFAGFLDDIGAAVGKGVSSVLDAITPPPVPFAFRLVYEKTNGRGGAGIEPSPNAEAYARQQYAEIAADPKTITVTLTRGDGTVVSTYSRPTAPAPPSLLAPLPTSRAARPSQMPLLLAGSAALVAAYFMWKGR